MDRGFTIITDGTSDLPEQLRKEEGIYVIPAPYFINEVEHTSVDDIKEFYKIMRDGTIPTTSQINIVDATNVFDKCLALGKDILVVGFSSVLSGSYFREKNLADEYNENPNNPRIYVVDSKMATTGEALVVWYANKLRQEGKTAKEVCDWIIKHNDEFCAYFTPNDLFHLQKGGRVSKASAIFGTMLGVKPVLHINIEGKLIPIDKMRGRKSALDALVDNMEKKTKGIDNPMVAIGHADCYEDAVYVKEQVEKRLGCKNFMIDFIGPVIGAHAGPGTVALFFMGDTRVIE